MNSENIKFDEVKGIKIWRLFKNDVAPYYCLTITEFKDGEFLIQKQETGGTANFYGDSLGEAMERLLNNKTGDGK